MLIAHQSAATRIPVRLVDGTGTPVTGMGAANVLGGSVFVVKGDGTTATLALSDGVNWFEIDDTLAPGLYHVLLPSGDLGVLGPTQLSVQPASTAFIGTIGTFLVEVFQATVATISTNVSAVNTKLGTPSGASVSADIATATTAATGAQTAANSASTNAAAAAAAALIVRKIQTNHWKVVGNQLVIYDDNKTTPIYTFNLFDDTGAPTMTKIFERTPTP